jgi:transposase
LTEHISGLINTQPKQRGAGKTDYWPQPWDFTTKLHAVVDALGNPLKLLLTGGDVHDIVPASDMLSDFSGCNVLADKGYDSATVVSDLESRGNIAVIPSRSNLKNPRDYDHHLYKERHLVVQETRVNLSCQGYNCGFIHLVVVILQTLSRRT